MSAASIRASGPAQPVATCPPPVAAAAVALLEQCRGFLTGFDGACEGYAKPSAAMAGGTIGKHVRHCLDHFRAALDGAEGRTVIDYDHRERNVPMETRVEAALEAISDLRSRLTGLAHGDLESTVRVRVMLSGDGCEAELTSTLGRELAFATHHAVHHHAMMGVIAAELGRACPADFGKAPSTINYDRRNG